MAYRDPVRRPSGSIGLRRCTDGGMTFFRGGGLSESTHPKIGEKNVANFAAVTNRMCLYRAW